MIFTSCNAIKSRISYCAPLAAQRLRGRHSYRNERRFLETTELLSALLLRQNRSGLLRIANINRWPIYSSFGVTIIICRSSFFYARDNSFGEDIFDKCPLGGPIAIDVHPVHVTRYTNCILCLDGNVMAEQKRRGSCLWNRN